MSDESHTQCRLRKDGVKQYICYIPSKFAQIGRVLDIKIDGEWEENWVVEHTYNTLPTIVVREREQDYKNTRKASDI